DPRVSGKVCSEGGPCTGRMQPKTGQTWEIPGQYLCGRLTATGQTASYGRAGWEAPHPFTSPADRSPSGLKTKQRRIGSAASVVAPQLSRQDRLPPRLAVRIVRPNDNAETGSRGELP